MAPDAPTTNHTPASHARMEPLHRLRRYAPVDQRWLRAARLGTRTTTRLAYWLAVLLPLAYVVALPAFAAGFVDLSTVVAITTLHATALLLGHVHDPGN